VDRIRGELDQLADHTLQRSEQGMDRLLSQTGLAKPDDIVGWHDVLELLEDVSKTVETFGPEIFGENLQSYYLATGDRKQRKRIAPDEKIGWIQRYRLVTELRRMTQGKIRNKAALHSELNKVREQRHRWKQLGGPNTEPSKVEGLAQVVQDYEFLQRQL